MRWGVKERQMGRLHDLVPQDLLPEKRMLNFANLSKAVGSDYLGARVRKLKPAAHVFGHTHFAWDSEIDGTRYVQWPLGYPRRCASSQAHARSRH